MTVCVAAAHNRLCNNTAQLNGIDTGIRAAFKARSSPISQVTRSSVSLGECDITRIEYSPTLGQDTMVGPSDPSTRHRICTMRSTSPSPSSGVHRRSVGRKRQHIPILSWSATIFIIHSTSAPLPKVAIN